MIHKGHKYKFDSDPWFSDIQKYNFGYTKKLIYAWTLPSGELLCPPDDDFNRISSLKEEMEKKVENRAIILSQFYYDDAKIILRPVCKEKKRVGGHAVGHNSNCEQDVFDQFHLILKKQYVGYPDTKIYIKDKSVFIEHDNVRAWVTFSNDLGICVSNGCPYVCSAHYSMIEKWNSDYHDIHIGDFIAPDFALQEAIVHFIRFQIEEQFVGAI